MKPEIGEQALFLTSWVKDFARACSLPEFDLVNWKRTGEKIVRFKNGSVIRVFTRGHSLRGFDPSIIILDESELVSDLDYQAIAPSKLVTRAQVLLLGTVWDTTGFFYEAIQNFEKLDYGFSRITSPEAVIPNGPISSEELARLKDELGEAKFNQECLLIPASLEGGLFPLEVCEKMGVDVPPITMGQLPPDCQPILSWDPAVALEGDDSIAKFGVVLPANCTVVLATRKLEGTIDQQVGQITSEFGSVPNLRCIIDGSGALGEIVLAKMREYNLSCGEYDFGGNRKPTLMFSFKEELSNGHFKDSDPILKRQMLHYRFRPSERMKGHYKFGQPGWPDDYVDSAALLAFLGRSFRERQAGGDESNVFFVGDESHGSSDNRMLICHGAFTNQ